MWVIALALAAASQGAVSSRLTPGAVERRIIDHGAKAVIDDLWKAGGWDQVEKGIAAGIPAWIRLAPRLSDGTDAGTSEGLGQSLIVALPKAPAAVLAVLDVNSRFGPRSPKTVCSASFYEGDPTNIPQYRARAIGALSRVGDPALASAKRACLAHLEAGGH